MWSQLLSDIYSSIMSHGSTVNLCVEDARIGYVDECAICVVVVVGWMETVC